jgi:alcohol dehydrogenase/L-iditol 2-dehydrogenase
MQAVVKFGQKPNMVELRDVPVPPVRPGAVLLEVKAAAVCGWDIEMWQHRMANPVTVPVIQGHEFCGVIAELGPGVTHWKKGDRVACETSALVCGKCFLCRQGDYQLCPDRRGFGYGVDGAFARYVVARAEILHALPSGLPYEEAALTEPFCVAHHALVDRITVKAGDTAAVIGPGPVGLIALQMAKLQGAARTLLIGTQGDQRRMQLAAEQGWADSTIMADRDNPASAVREFTAGQGADIVVDCAGNSAALLAALAIVRRGGQIVKIGWGPKPFEHSLDELLRKSVALVGTFGHNWHNWEDVLRLLTAKRLSAGPLISAVLPLSKWQQAFEMMESRKAIKVVLVPEE